MAETPQPQETTRTALRSINSVVVGTTLAKRVTTTLVSATNAIAMDCSVSDNFINTPTETTTITPSNIQPNQIVIIHFTTSGTSSFTTTFGTGMHSTGTLASGTTDARNFIVVFKGNAAGTALYEVSRTAAYA